ncbi:DNA-binding response regulator [Leucothrix arctica]|uniref:DNA-binding response regulator n=1 Tax=Leucothrix arctica TaxID=1481894 RepID=A0A317CHD8_9GAMM|nr:DNA-binding response regulator [Leucothrix arctica]PWQ97779.1 DNA-binding response regulator [Leucothrix arctica]
MTPKDSKGIVLIADDSAEALGMLNTTLVSYGYTVFVAMDGAQALAIAKQMVPDMILLDIMMPTMNGIEACKALKADSELNHIPVIFMTGLCDQEHILEGLSAGAVDYINKPVNLDELLARVKNHLKNSQSTRSAQSALNELGQLTFTCDVNAKLVWTSISSRKLLTKAGVDVNTNFDAVAAQISEWLSRSPAKHSKLSLKGVATPLQLSFLGKPTPREYLLRITEDDEIGSRRLLKDRFALTEREAEVLFWLSRGKTNREIGQIISTSPRTVNKHLEAVFRKLDVENRSTATAVCLSFLGNW